MSKKIKEVILDSTTPFGVGLYVDDRAMIKYQTLVQDYHELQKEVDMMRSRLEAGKQRKMILAAEVGFLRKRFGCFMETKTEHLSQKEKMVQPSNLHEQNTRRREANLRLLMLPPIPEVRPKKKKQYISKEKTLCGSSPVMQHHRKMLAGLTTLSDLMSNTATVVDLNQKNSMHGATPRNTSAAIDLNEGDCWNVKELSASIRAPIFDLNEISTGDEDDVEARGSLTRNPLMVSVCRNGGEGASRVVKRKISWQDPVALSV